MLIIYDVDVNQMISAINACYNLLYVLAGLKNEMKAYEIDKITSRKIVENLIEEFVGIPKA